MATKRTYQPSSTRRSRRLGFRKKMESSGGQDTLRRRRAKGRKKLTTV